MGILAVTAIFNIFGWPFHSLVPVIGKDNLALGPEGVGILSSMEGVGAMVGAAWIVLLAKPEALLHALYVGAVARISADDAQLCTDVGTGSRPARS